MFHCMTSLSLDGNLQPKSVTFNHTFFLKTKCQREASLGRGKYRPYLRICCSRLQPCYLPPYEPIPHVVVPHAVVPRC